MVMNTSKHQSGSRLTEVLFGEVWNSSTQNYKINESSKKLKEYSVRKILEKDTVRRQSMFIE